MEIPDSLLRELDAKSNGELIGIFGRCASTDSTHTGGIGYLLPERVGSVSTSAGAWLLVPKSRCASWRKDKATGCIIPPDIAHEVAQSCGLVFPICFALDVIIELHHLSV